MNESFWDFSVRTYRSENVAEACLALQDERGVDVNLLLFCCWFAATRGAIDDNKFNLVYEFSESWAENVVRPLRKIRTWMKSTGCRDARVPTDDCMAYREQVKSIEFKAERMQQDMLASFIQDIPAVALSTVEQIQSVNRNVKNYFDIINVKADEWVREKLVIIIRAAFVKSTNDELSKYMNF